MNYPKYILKDIYWAFSEGPIKEIEEFATRLETYHKGISMSKKMPFKWNDIAFKYSKIEIQYLKYDDEEEDYNDEFETITADNNKNFTFKELFFKIHQIGVNLQDDDNCYFEGLTFSGTVEEGVPTYFMITGS